MQFTSRQDKQLSHVLVYSIFALSSTILCAGADVPPIEKGNRRETREIFRSKETVLAANQILRPGEKHIWNIG